MLLIYVKFRENQWNINISDSFAFSLTKGLNPLFSVWKLLNLGAGDIFALQWKNSNRWSVFEEKNPDAYVEWRLQVDWQAINRVSSIRRSKMCYSFNLIDFHPCLSPKPNMNSVHCQPNSLADIDICYPRIRIQTQAQPTNPFGLDPYLSTFSPKYKAPKQTPNPFPHFLFISFSSSILKPYSPFSSSPYPSNSVKATQNPPHFLFSFFPSRFLSFSLEGGPLVEFLGARPGFRWPYSKSNLGFTFLR